MNYQIVQREEDNFIKFYVATKDDDTTYEIPCILDADGDVDTIATQNKMDSYIIESDLLMSYLGE